MRQPGNERSALCFGKAFDGIHEMNVRPASLQKVDEVFAQRFVIVARRGFLLGGWLCFFFHHGIFQLPELVAASPEQDEESFLRIPNCRTSSRIEQRYKR